MVSSEVQRTLVKSPPELWAELGDPASLARHLGEFGEIRIIRAEPETTVEWTAENITGTVSIKPSGWGTKVTLSVSRQLDEPVAEATAPAPQPASVEPEVVAEPDSVAQPRVSAEPEAAAAPITVPGPELEGAVEPKAAAALASTQTLRDREPHAGPADTEQARATVPSFEVEQATQPCKGFFVRLFGRRRKKAPAVDAPAPDRADKQTSESASRQANAFAAVRQALAPESFAATHAFATDSRVQPTDVDQGAQASAAQAPAPASTETPAHASTEAPTPACAAQTAAEQAATTAQAEGEEPREAEPAPTDISAELLEGEQVAVEEVTAVLTAVLDRLGAAHHRPFSRA
ncbi:MAG TPA: hypothetical protein VMF09_05420 [Solirubrobacteraceae bacterium]|nr:hypothetical protein [Solirubrobacteraceae bacterium]